MNFLSHITGSFADPCAENPTVAMIEAAYRHHGMDWRYINCNVKPQKLADAVRGARAMGWEGFNCSLPQGGGDPASRWVGGIGFNHGCGELRRAARRCL